MKTIKYFLLSALFITLPSSASTTSKTILYKPLENEKVINFIESFSKEGFYTKDELFDIFSKTKIEHKKISKKQSNQGEKKLTWETYKDRVVTPFRITTGKLFLNANLEVLQRAEDTFNVDKEVIVSILGVETNYGYNKGNFRAIDALSTLSFEYYPRSKFFNNELRSFLKLSKKNNMSPFETKSSWAGAIGYAQFIPSSIIAYGVDFDNDGKIDLVNSLPDAIGSVANYLNKHGFIKGDNYFDIVSIKHPVSNGLKLENTCKTIKLENKEYCNSKFKIFKLDGNNYVASNNFYSITMYNRSNLYAAAVLEIAKSLKD